MTHPIVDFIELPGWRYFGEAITRVAEERKRARDKHGNRTPGNTIMVDLERLAILSEEYTELQEAHATAMRKLAQSVVDGKDEAAVRAELIQVAATSVAWLEALEARRIRREGMW